jgi:hypothetical protein
MKHPGCFTEKERFILSSGYDNYETAEIAWFIERENIINIDDILQNPALLEKYADRIA